MYLGHSPTNAGSFIFLDDIASGFNGSETQFTLQVGGVNITPNTQNLLIALDGIIQQAPDAYTVSGSTITFTGAVPSGTDFYGILMGQSASIGQGTIGADELKISGNGTSGQLIKSDGDGTYSYVNQSAVTTDANVLSGTTLKSTVVNSSLTSVGTLTTLTVDNITINGSDVNNSTGNFTFSHGGSEKLRITSDKVMFSADAKVDANNTRDLGTSGTRWKDLYLAGDANVGGTGSFAGRITTNDGFKHDDSTYNLLIHGNITGGTGGIYSTSNNSFGIWTNSTLALTLTNSQNANFAGNITVDTGGTSIITADGNNNSGDDGRLVLKGHTSSQSRAYVKFNNGVSSGGQDWFLGALRGSNAFALSTVDDSNGGTNVFTVDGNKKIGIGTDPNNSYKVKVSGNIYADTTSQFLNALIGGVTIDSTSYSMLGSNSSSTGIAICRDGSASYPDFLIKSGGNAHFNNKVYADNMSFFVDADGDSGNGKFGFLFSNSTNMGVAQVRTSGGRGLVLGRQSVSASTWTTIADTHWGGTALVAWAGTGVQGMDMVAYGYNSPVTVLYSSQWVGSQSRSYAGSTYQLQINIGTAATVWVLFLGT